MNKLKQIGPWIAFALLVIIALGTFFSFATVAAFLAAAIILPVPQWQALLQKHIKGKVKTVVAIVLSVLALLTVPSVDTGNKATLPTESTSTLGTTLDTSETTVPTDSTTVTTKVTEVTTAPTTVAPTETSTEATVTPTTPATQPTTEPTTAPTTVPSITPTTAPVHEHSYSDATCTNPKTCSCGATEGSANGHSWNNATCTEAKVCSVCGITDGSVLGHNYANGVCSTCGSSDPNFTDNSSNLSDNSGIAGDPDGDDTNGQVVYRTPSGKRYHIDPDCGGKNSYQITLGEAVSAGLTPCNTCTK